MVRHLHLSSVVIVASMSLSNIGVSVVQFVVQYGGICELSFAPGAIDVLCWCTVRRECTVSSLPEVSITS